MTTITPIYTKNLTVPLRWVLLSTTPLFCGRMKRVQELSSFELVVGGAFTILDRGTVIYGPFVGRLPTVGESLELVRPGRETLRVGCAGTEDMWRGTADGREFGVLITGASADDVEAGDMLRRLHVP